MSDSDEKVHTPLERLKNITENEPEIVVRLAIDIFFQALSRGDEETTQAAPIALRQALPDESRAREWAAYLETILDIENYRWDQAEQRALETLRWAEEESLRGRLFNELGILSDQLGRWRESIHYYRSALALFEAVDDQMYVGKVVKNWGTALVRGVESGELPREDLPEAEGQERRALAIFQALQHEGLEAATCNELGAVLKAQEHWEEAKHCYEHFADFCRQHDDAWGRGQALNNISEVLSAQDKIEQAILLWRQALTLVQGHLWDEVDIQTHLAQAYKQIGDLKTAQQWSESAIALVESMRSRLQIPQIRTDFFAFHQQPYRIAAGIALARNNAALVLTLAERAKARTFADLLAKQLRTSQSVKVGKLETEQPLTTAMIQTQLPADAGLLAYFETDETLIAMLVRRDHLLIKPLSASLKQIAGASFDRHGRPRGLIREDGRLGEPWLLSKLGALLLQPLSESLSGLRRLWVAPHGLLHHLPLTAMPVTVDGRLLEEIVPQVAQTPSATILLRYLQTRPQPGGDNIFLGYNAQYLRYAEQEAAVLAKQGGATALLGEKATLTALRAHQIPGGTIHLACPGVFRPDQPLRSGLMLADGFLDVAQVFASPPMQAGLVTLSACETGRGHLQGGDEIVGLVRAWLFTGTAAVLVSLWQADDLSSLLLMSVFYRHLPTTGAAKALQQAKQALRGLTASDIEKQCRDLGVPTEQLPGEMNRFTQMWGGKLPDLPLDHPYFWAAFVLHGDMV